MGFRFRKSANFGPLRINFSKSGMGYSFGGKGFRVTKKAGGGMRTTASIPGTGMSYVKDYGSGKKKSSGSTPASSGNVETTPKKPFYQRPWFVVLMVVILLGAVGNACSSDNEGQTNEAAIQQEETTDTKEPSVTEAEDTAKPEDAPDETTEEQEGIEPAQEAQESQEEPQASTPAQESQNTPEMAPAGSEGQESSGSAPVIVTPPASTPAGQTEQSAQTDPEPQQQTNVNDRTVYVTETGKRYHYDSNCGNGTYYESTLSQAESRGLTPCQKCAGG